MTAHVAPAWHLAETSQHQWGSTATQGFGMLTAGSVAFWHNTSGRAGALTPPGRGNGKERSDA